MMMDILYKAFLALHVVAGLLALPVFWLPALTRKGSPLHRRAGRWFVILMSIVAITGVPLTARFFMLGHWVAATFLAYLLVITVTAISTAWFALKLKHDPQRYFGIPHRVLSVVNIVAGGSVLYMGLTHDVLLLTLFSFIGLFAGVDGLRQALKPGVREANWWLHEHFGGMIGGGIAAHVAFGAFGLRRLWPAYADFDGFVGFVGMLPWMVPVVLGIAASAYYSRKYRHAVPGTPG